MRTVSMPKTRLAIRTVLLAGLVASAPTAVVARAADSEALVVLDIGSPSVRDEIPSAAPPRFVLHPDGLVFTGGTSVVSSGRLDKERIKAIEARIARIRKMSGLGATLTLGPGADTYRLRLPKARLEILAKGDPTKAPTALAPLASFLVELASFHHPSLRRYSPVAYLLSAREGTLPGGCRSWSLPVPLAAALAGAETVPARSAVGWPTGAAPASVCDGAKHYVVTLSPVIPGAR